MDWFVFGDIHIYFNPRDFADNPPVELIQLGPKLWILRSVRESQPCSFCLKS